jgi:hypothetical protein
MISFYFSPITSLKKIKIVQSKSFVDEVGFVVSALLSLPHIGLKFLDQSTT